MIFPSFQICACCKKCLKDSKHNTCSLQFGTKIHVCKEFFFLGHYLFLKLSVCFSDQIMSTENGQGSSWPVTGGRGVNGLNLNATENDIHVCKHRIHRIHHTNLFLSNEYNCMAQSRDPYSHFIWLSMMTKES